MTQPSVNPTAKVFTVYEVWEQWPHTLIASFFELADAHAFVQSESKSGRIALPLITSHIVMPTQSVGQTIQSLISKFGV